MEKPLIEVLLSLDTTGSMYPCASQLRRKAVEFIDRLFETIPGIRIGIIAHGDYCDAGYTYVIKSHKLSTDRQSLIRFVRSIEATGGGDAPECYELALHEARGMGWTADSKKVLVMAGDDVPHGAKERQNTKGLDWENELRLLQDLGVRVYGVQCLNRPHAHWFWRDLAEKTEGYHLTLDQFAALSDLIVAICYQQVGRDQLIAFEREVFESGRGSRGLYQAFGTLGVIGVREEFTVKAELEPVAPGRFQIIHIDSSLRKDDSKIRDFARSQGLEFKKGRGFYELTKPEIVQEDKEVVLLHEVTGDMWTGDEAREMIGAPVGTRVRVKPKEIPGFVPFVQSNSWNRNLVPGTRFLYEVDMSR